jgi:hypothetical protein
MVPFQVFYALKLIVMWCGSIAVLLSTSESVQDAIPTQTVLLPECWGILWHTLDHLLVVGGWSEQRATKSDE